MTFTWCVDVHVCYVHDGSLIVITSVAHNVKYLSIATDIWHNTTNHACEHNDEYKKMCGKHVPEHTPVKQARRHFSTYDRESFIWLQTGTSSARTATPPALTA